MSTGRGFLEQAIDAEIVLASWSEVAEWAEDERSRYHALIHASRAFVFLRVASRARVHRSRKLLLSNITIAALSVLVAACTRDPEKKISFNEIIQPILSENCYGCHGPDSSSRRAGLRLDRAEFAFAPHAEFGPAIIPGKPDRSPLIRRIEATNPKERMPPPEAHKTLKAEQIAHLRQWIAQGANYEPHWAFIPPKRPVVPAASTPEGNKWARNEIDQFILARLENEGLQPSPQADKRTLIRRVTYDLTGLPPSPEEVEAFVADTASDAYERLVDRLLATPLYGEHRAHYWLDYVRYSDTHGLHIDNYRAIWPYRDYVIKAYNDNKPFDEFVREQLAGDLLPAQTLDTLTATGLMRLNVTTNEAGTIREEVSVNLARDRVETFGVVFLGLTTGCAACHDHKFDPTTQKDFYQLAALLTNTKDGPLDFNTPDPPPVIRFPDPKNRPAYDALLTERAMLLARLEQRRVVAPDLIQAQASAGHGPRPVSAEKLEARLRFDEGQGEVVRNGAPDASPAEFKVEGSSIIWGEMSWLWPSARFGTGTRLSLGDVGNVEANDSFSVGGWVMPRQTGAQSFPSGALIARLGDPNGQNKRGWGIFYRSEPSLARPNRSLAGHVYLVLVSDPENPKPKKRTSENAALDEGQFLSSRLSEPMERAITVKVRAEVRTEQWAHIFVTYDGSRKAQGVRVYLNGKPAAVDVLNDTLRSHDSIRTAAATHIGRRDDDEPLRETRYQDIRFYRRALSADEVAQLPYEDVAAEIVSRQHDPTKWNSDQTFAVVEGYFLGEHDEEAKKLRRGIEDAEARLEALAPPPGWEQAGPSENPIFLVQKRGAANILQQFLGERPSSLIAQERPSPAYAHILKRGDYASRVERVGAGTPHFLPPLPDGARPDRLALANWLLAQENPLFARVAVNRMWQEVFGTGLVETSGDFGLTGTRPSHPQLLDWLAVEFRETGWDVKRLYKKLVLSATYRQAATVRPELLQADAANRLLARGPRFRMDAEGVRDSALAVSGLLVGKMGGPPVKPYQPPGLWREVAMPESNTKDYSPDSGENLYRRSLYTFWKRSSPPPSLETFDAPTRETACTRRARANTPLQALVTLNDPQFVEAARVLARRVLRSAPDSDDRIEQLAEITLSRPLDNKERSIVEQSRKMFEKRFRESPQDATELLSVGEAPADAELDPSELATWTMVASQFLNLDEFLTK